MKFQELLKKLDVDALAEAYLMYDGIYRKTMYNDKLTESEKNVKIRKYRAFIKNTVEEFRSVIVTEGTEMILFCYDIENSNHNDLFCHSKNSFPTEQIPHLDVFASRIKELFDASKDYDFQHYAIEYTVPEEILGYEVSETARYLYGDMLVATAILYEMTWNGYTVNAIHRKLKRFWRELTRSQNENTTEYDSEEINTLFFGKDFEHEGEEPVNTVLKEAENLILDEKRRFEKNVFRIIANAEKQMIDLSAIRQRSGIDRIFLLTLESGGAIDVYICTDDDVKTPHFHVRKLDKNSLREWETCISLRKAEYCQHQSFSGEFDKELSAEIPDEIAHLINDKFKAKTGNGRYADETYWDRALDCWNSQNKNRISSDARQPDYGKIEKKRWIKKCSK